MKLFPRGLTDEGRPILNATGTMPLTGVPDRIKEAKQRRKPDGHQQASLLLLTWGTV